MRSGKNHECVTKKKRNNKEERFRRTRIFNFDSVNKT